MGVKDKLEAEANNRIRDAERLLGKSTNDGTTIQLDDGREISLSQLKSEHMMQKDYTQKTQKLSEQVKEIDTLREELDKRRQMGENMNLYFAERPDVFEDVKKFVETGKSDLTKVEGKETQKETEKKPEEKPEKKEVEDKDKLARDQYLKEIDDLKQKVSKLDTNYNNVNQNMSRMEVDNAIVRYKKRWEIKSDTNVDNVIKYVSENYHPSKNYDDNFDVAHKILGHENREEELRLQAEKEKATMFSGRTNSKGEPVKKTDGQRIFETATQSKGIDIFK